jgi:hypothetical protein
MQSNDTSAFWRPKNAYRPGVVGRAAAGGMDGVSSVPVRAHLTTGSGNNPKTSSSTTEARITARDIPPTRGNGGAISGRGFMNITITT